MSVSGFGKSYFLVYHSSFCSFCSYIKRMKFVRLKGIFQKQPSIGFLRKKCSENMQQRKHTCRSEISIKLLFNFIKSHFSTGVLLYICCIFSEYLFKRTPTKCYFSYSGISQTPIVNSFQRFISAFSGILTS